MRGIFFVNTCQRTKQPNRVASFVGGATLSSSRALPPLAAESGPHSPLGGRGACSPDGERANIRQRRNSENVARFFPSLLHSAPKCAIINPERRWKHENRIQRSQTKEKGYIFFTWNICCGMFPCCAWKTMVVFFHPIDVFPVGFHSCAK